jgi:hypothetical protein
MLEMDSKPTDLWAPRHRTDDEWESLARYFVSSFGRAVGSPARLVKAFSVQSTVVDDLAICLEVCPVSEPEVLDLTWFAIVGMQPNQGRQDVSASLFFFAGQRRLVAPSEREDFCEYTLDPEVGWLGPVWLADEHYEYESITWEYVLAKRSGDSMKP